MTWNSLPDFIRDPASSADCFMVLLGCTGSHDMERKLRHCDRMYIDPLTTNYDDKFCYRCAIKLGRWTQHYCRYDSFADSLPWVALLFLSLRWIWPPPAALTSCVLLLFLICLLIVFIFNDSLQTDLKIYRIDIRRVCKVGRTMAVDDQSEISFSRDVAMATDFCWCYPQNWVPVIFGRWR